MPERPPASYATAYCRFRGKLRQSSKVLLRDTKVALRGQIPRGVSSDHVLTRVFGDTSSKA